MVLPPELVGQVVACLNSEERQALGFSVDACISLKIPPAPLLLDEAFLAKLVDLQQRRLTQHGVHVFKKDDSVLVTVNFTRIPWMYPHDLLIMCVRPHATIWRMRIDDVDDDVVWSLSIADCRYYICHDDRAEMEEVEVSRCRDTWTRRRSQVLFK
jgi:hypothetical protein